MALGLLITSCSKNKNNPQTEEQQEYDTSVASASHITQEEELKMEKFGQTADRLGGEDDDEPIIMHMGLNVHGRPVSGTTVIFTNNSDTLIKYSNIFGETFFRLPRRGIWNVSVSHIGYITIHNSVNVDHQHNLKVDILKVQ